MPGAETLGPVAPALEDGKAPDAVEAETVPATLETDAEEKQNPKTVASSPAPSHVADEGEGGEPKKNNDDSNGLPTPRYQPNELGTPLLTPTGLKTRPTSAPEVPSPAEPPFTQPTHPKPSVKEDKVVPESGKGGIKRKEFEDPFTTVTTPPQPLSEKAVYARIRRVFQKRKDGTFQLDDRWNEAWADTKGDGRRELLAMFEKVGYNPDRVDESDKHTWICFGLIFQCLGSSLPGAS